MLLHLSDSMSDRIGRHSEPVAPYVSQPYQVWRVDRMAALALLSLTRFYSRYIV